ncbi:MarR family transcriptional regulator [Nocardia arthritidis]|uniref:MarR family transcriptional regulator n=1 Tax=Nocardia arthritidis TaxID=228602 RepID=A0A6G9YDQ3_9NOCA|nr:MarR family transcriptional regulator [Nocardia arthritidis]QIS11260.1 MarR family transcriptional regulator [Nocardia arthritidis]
MTNVSDSARRHRRAAQAVKDSLRDLNTQLALLNRQFGAKVELRDVDWHCLDLINRHGPIGPGALAKLAALHPATMTGVLDRLQRAGWIVRERDPAASDRRAVAVRATRDRNPEVYRVLSGMNRRMDELCADYTEEQLAVIADFLHRTADAGRAAATELATE